ncbi:hypothetical protein BVG01_25005 [Bacillus anthracis]|nr:hypothetical protein BVG01_25005 [Bacillus anthracis]
MKLEDIHLKNDTALLQALKNRESIRKPLNNTLTFQKLSYILQYSFGIKEHVEKNRRYYPSAGARFPLECYVLINKCEDLPSGIYHYNVLDNTLEILLKEDVTNKIEDIFGFDWITHSHAAIFLTGMLERTTIKYGERGYRFTLIEAGHAMQNLCLLSSSINLSVTPVGGFADHKVSRLLRLVKDEEIPIYSAIIS